MGKALKVLVVDDHEIHRLMLAKIFEGLGCSVTAVDRAAEAVALAGAFDLICLDRHMPEMAGEDVARLIGPGVFRLACTSDADNLPQEHFDMVVAKPVSCDALQRAVHAARAARGSRPERQPSWVAALVEALFGPRARARA